MTTTASPTLFAGVDPGAGGAIALLDPVTQELTVLDMPVHEITVGRSKRKVLDLGTLARWFEMHAPSIKLAVVESVHAMPKQGVSSSFSFGFAAGALQAFVAASFTPMHLVSPAVWKRVFGLTSDKDASRRAVSRMFPRSAHLFGRKKDDGRAEAALLAVYGCTLVHRSKQGVSP